MSNRTRLSDKAIREAWKREKELVQEGKATRDWTPEQQQDILERGKAYDDNGKAFIGHHMISVENMPEYQGCQENIQFLTQEEHLAAHGGNFQNRTKGYYNPETGEMEEFEGSIYKPCRVIDLSSPIGWKADAVEEEKSAEMDSFSPSGERIESKAEAPPQNIEQKKPEMKESSGSSQYNYRREELLRIKNSIKLRAKKVGVKIIDITKRGAAYVVEHRYEIARGAVKVGTTIAKIYMEVKIDEMFDDGDDGYYYGKRDKDENDAENVKPAVTPVPDLEAKSDRSSPEVHTVKASGQHYWKGGERVWIEKAPYQRGGNKENDSETEGEQ